MIVDAREQSKSYSSSAQRVGCAGGRCTQSGARGCKLAEPQLQHRTKERPNPDNDSNSTTRNFVPQMTIYYLYYLEQYRIHLVEFYILSRTMDATEMWSACCENLYTHSPVETR